jgi:hypothetical protein
LQKGRGVSVPDGEEERYNIPFPTLPLGFFGHVSRLFHRYLNR